MRIYDAKVASTLVGVKVFAGGKIKEITVGDGDHVEAGQVLAHVEVSVTDEQIAQLEQTVELSKQNLAQVLQGQVVMTPVYSNMENAMAGADIARAEERMNRMNELYEMGAISAMKRDEAAAEYEAAVAASAAAPSVSFQTTTQPSSPEVIESAQIALRQSEAALENAKKAAQATEIVAPVAGTVYYTELSEGSEVRAGQTILNIGDSDRIWLEASITPQQKAQLQLGQLVSYELGGMELQGTVIEFDAKKDVNASISDGTSEGENSSEDADERVTVKISLPGSVPFDYKPGMSTTVKIRLVEPNTAS